MSANQKPESLNWDGYILLDPKHELHTTYGAGAESLYFIRPDGYVGFRWQPVREEHLARGRTCEISPNDGPATNRSK